MKVIDTITVPKIGSGIDRDTFRPDTTAPCWRVIDDLGDEMIIEIMELL